MPDLQTAIADLAGNPALAHLRRGIEKESLRVTQTGELSQQPHPPGLGSALTHPHITTDFSEAQLELITGVHDTAEACIDELVDVHRFVYSNLDDELLWTTSMPCILGTAEAIPIGRYGTSNIGKAKSVYRMGLGNRYGRLMQTISGIHYNFSIPEGLWPAIAASRGEELATSFKTRAYFDLIRNFRRHSWLLIYLFGASPAVCRSFVRGLDHQLDELDEGTVGLPGATSLRMGRLGYQSDAQSSLYVSYNNLERYAETMIEALTRPYPPYEKIGLNVNGEYQQLNTALLQIENEFYGTIRPKRSARSGERPLEALVGRGVEYVELRCLDLNPFLRVGIDTSAIKFIDAFILHCLLAPSPEDDEAESREIQANQLITVRDGRNQAVELTSHGRAIALRDWANTLLDEVLPIAAIMDKAVGDDEHTFSVETQRQKVADPNQTPSARVLEGMRSQRLPFARFALQQSAAHKGYFDEHPLRPHVLQRFEAQRDQSVVDQAGAEASDTRPFDEFLVDYLRLDLNSP